MDSEPEEPLTSALVTTSQAIEGEILSAEDAYEQFNHTETEVPEVLTEELLKERLYQMGYRIAEWHGTWHEDSLADELLGLTVRVHTGDEEVWPPE